VNKAELVAQVAKESDLSKDAAEKAVDATFKNIEKALKGGDTVRIVGFGNFQVALVQRYKSQPRVCQNSVRAKPSKRPATASLEAVDDFLGGAPR
jgi:nucleoid DNA-binding protein